jgi:hypothetical protein
MDTVLGVYTGNSLFDLTLVAQDDNGAPDGIRSRVRFDATVGTHYLVAVDGVNGGQGSIQLNVQLGQAPQVGSSTSTNSVVAAGSGLVLNSPSVGGEVKYQWRRDGEVLAGATNATLVVAGVGLADGGSYTVEVRNEFGEVERGVASVAVELTLLGRTPEIVGGMLRVTVQRPAGQAVVVESSSDLATWSPVATVPYSMAGPQVEVPLTNVWQFLRARFWP